MTSYNISLRTLGDREGIPAKLTLEGGELGLNAGGHEIGLWPIDEVELEPTGTGYRMTAEGETIILDFENVAPFQAEVSKVLEAKGHKKRGRKRRQRQGRPAETVATPTGPAPDQEQMVPGQPDSTEPAPAAAAEPGHALQAETSTGEPGATTSGPASVPEPEPKPPPARPKVLRVEKPEGEESIKARLLRILDNGLAYAEEKAGALLPGWVFTRGMAAVLFVLLVLGLIFPGLASIVLFILGALVVILGAIAYSDDIVASRWLPGRSTPGHVLITGLVLILLGVGFALLAR